MPSLVFRSCIMLRLSLLVLMQRRGAAPDTFCMARMDPLSKIFALYYTECGLPWVALAPHTFRIARTDPLSKIVAAYYMEYGLPLALLAFAQGRRALDAGRSFERMDCWAPFIWMLSSRQWGMCAAGEGAAPEVLLLLPHPGHPRCGH